MACHDDNITKIKSSWLLSLVFINAHIRLTAILDMNCTSQLSPWSCQEDHLSTQRYAMHQSMITANPQPPRKWSSTCCASACTVSSTAQRSSTQNHSHHYVFYYFQFRFHQPSLPRIIPGGVSSWKRKLFEITGAVFYRPDILPIIQSTVSKQIC